MTDVGDRIIRGSCTTADETVLAQLRRALSLEELPIEVTFLEQDPRSGAWLISTVVDSEGDASSVVAIWASLAAELTQLTPGNSWPANETAVGLYTGGGTTDPLGESLTNSDSYVSVARCAEEWIRANNAPPLVVELPPSTDLDLGSCQRPPIEHLRSILLALNDEVVSIDSARRVESARSGETFLAAVINLAGQNAEPADRLAVWVVVDGFAATNLSTTSSVWSATDLAADHSQAPMLSTLFGSDDQLEHAATALECARVAAETDPRPVYPNPDVLELTTVVSSRCISPTAPDIAAITGGLLDGAEPASGFVSARPEAFGSKDVEWYMAVDVHVDESIVPPVAIWVLTVSPDGSSTVRSANDVAMRVSSLPPADVVELQGLDQAALCVQDLPPLRPPAPLITYSGCQPADSDLLTVVLSRLRSDDYSLKSVRAVQQVTQYANGEVEEGDLVIVSADIDGPGLPDLGPFGAWLLIRDGSGFTTVAVSQSLNDAAAIFSRIPDLPVPLDVDQVDQSVTDQAVSCAQREFATGARVAIDAIPRDTDLGRCVTPDNALLDEIRNALPGSDISIEASSMVRSTVFDDISELIGNPDIWFLAARLSGPGIRAPHNIGIWGVVIVDGDISAAEVSPISPFAAGITDQQPDEFTAVIVNWDGYLEAEDCVLSVPSADAEYEFQQASCVPAGAEWAAFIGSGLTREDIELRNPHIAWSIEEGSNSGSRFFLAATIGGAEFEGANELAIFAGSAQQGSQVVWITGADRRSSRLFDPVNFAALENNRSYSEFDAGYLEAMECAHLASEGELASATYALDQYVWPPLLGADEERWCSPGGDQWTEFLDERMPRFPSVFNSSSYGVPASELNSDDFFYWMHAVEIEGAEFEGFGNIAILLQEIPFAFDGEILLAPVNQLALDLFDFGDETLDLAAREITLTDETIGVQRANECGELMTAIAERRSAMMAGTGVGGG